MPGRIFTPGAVDLRMRIELLAERLTPGLKPLAPVAYNYAWSWDPDGPGVFRDINPHRWQLSGENPVRFLNDLWPSTQEAAERNPELLARVEALAGRIDAMLSREPVARGIDGPVVFMCAEFGFHASMPIYSGGLGVLAGDILKEASDQALEMVGIGLLYRRGYFRQRLDLSGRQQEYWLELDPKSLPMARVTSPDGSPFLLEVELYGAPMQFQAWRVDVGRVPLLLLDAELPENDAVQRWTTARLYDGSRAVRLAQYGLLGLGGARMLEALEIHPAVVHLNEGHPALAALELASRAVAGGASTEQALETVRERVVFTTHTPVAAGNETYTAEEFLAAYSGLPARIGLDDETLLDLCRVVPGEGEPGMTPLALRLSRSRNGVSRLHGEVAREMWRPLFPGPEEVPIAHVTNGAHLSTFISAPMRDLFVRHLDGRWLAAPADRASWEGVLEIPNAELWAARCEARRRLVDFVRAKEVQDSLLRGEQLDFIRLNEETLEPDALTIGFARRLATYKRFHLLAHDPERARRIFTGDRAAQLVIAGKAHPNDSPGKDDLQRFYAFEHADAEIAGRVVILEDYDISIARHLVSGCDVWVNLPRRPMEASGTSGMKATFNGGLQLSVLDGWWAEGYDGSNGWAIPGEGDEPPEAIDARDAALFYDLLEYEIVPLFRDRDEAGVPHGWCELIKRALLSLAPTFTATRMVDDYVDHVYRG